VTSAGNAAAPAPSYPRCARSRTALDAVVRDRALESLARDVDAPRASARPGRLHGGPHAHERDAPDRGYRRVGLRHDGRVQVGPASRGVDGLHDVRPGQVRTPVAGLAGLHDDAVCRGRARPSG